MFDKSRCRVLVFALAGSCGLGCHASLKAGEPGQPVAPAATTTPPSLETVHEFRQQMPTGVTVSAHDRIFVSYPRWDDPIAFTVGELREGHEVPYPNEAINRGESPEQLYSVQSVVIDARDRLWAIDTGSLNMKPIRGPEWVKLVGIDLGSGRVVKTIHFPPGVVNPGSYFNDVRFDLRRGTEGMAFISDSAATSDNAIVVVDLASGRSWRKLNGHPSVTGDHTFQAIMEGKPLVMNRPDAPPDPHHPGVDGIALSADGTRLFYCPLMSRNVYSVSLDALEDEKLADAEVAKTVRQESRRFASDGLLGDADGRLFLTDWEHNAIVERDTPDHFTTLVHDQRLWWPDTLALSRGGFLYVTANQLHRMPRYHDGKDLRQKPFFLFRVKVGGGPVLLAGSP